MKKRANAYVWGSSAALMALSAFLVYQFSFLSVPITIVVLGAVFVSLFILEKPYVALVLIAFLLPFERIGSFELAGSTVRTSQLVGLLMLVSWFAYGAFRSKVFSAKNPTLIPIALFFAASILSFSHAVNFERALTVFLFEVFVILVSVAVPNLLKDKDLLVRVIVSLFATTALVSLFGIFQFLGDMAGLPTEITGLREQYTKAVFGFPRVQSTALEPLYFGNFLLIPVSLALALFFGAKKRVKKLHPLFIITIVLLGGLNILLTVSRGAYLGLGVAVLLIGFLYMREFLKPQRFFPLLFAVMLIFGGAFFLFGLEEENVDAFIGQATNITEGAGVEERFESYFWALDLFEVHSILGVGVGNYGPSISKHPLVTPDDGWLIVNNVYLEILAERGVLGLCAFMLIVAAVVIRSIKAIRFSKDVFLKTVLAGLLVAFVAILVQYATFSILYIFHVWFLVGLIVAVQNLIFNQSVSGGVSEKN
jgi:O-antigen ligase